MDWSELPSATDAVFLPENEYLGHQDRITIIYVNESANNQNGSFEIEYLDARGILKTYTESVIKSDNNCSVEEYFFDLLPDMYQGMWYYCDNVPETQDSFNDYVKCFYHADFVYGRDGDLSDEMILLVKWALRQFNRCDSEPLDEKNIPSQTELLDFLFNN